ncbi:bifunctional hydroxymethylpyrimidine kinase/phosphomethylpyrimidine kinase [Sinorhizobium numidicum]|uniref:hydroxymethylpyrimidine kinase n=1 Tax=Sinorhizobium numidicum TaxID=680248 RepID=A0ABY8CUA0_9HYPH|nr:bifunctional hydroxymethylpyrimidine kinase/phosphomethylpyrimidine kinase [Sinorhizobium numidicum]WEX75480.1 bifunctional hydroxymethylpyrimidine kinase/phosphomethylpyrimidine kinase [Sinorhizobium numidicum]WEX81477.1 bifunctional hydroxymethylpyrimidine kinase/phosphomethylpyrimidine kinase [Sinorhizobium numidicum]
MTAIALTIAGSDSGGGAGIQADLKTFSALGVYGASVITAITAQNTKGVSAVEDISPKMVAAQIDAVFSDLDVAAAKVGMVSRSETIAAIADALQRFGRRAVVDPVMVATSGDRLLQPDALEALVKELLPLALVVTPNLAEAALLTGRSVAADEAEMARQAEAILKTGAHSVLVKGGHLKSGEATDLFFDGDGLIRLPAPRVETHNDHGTGCTLSAAIAAGLALGQPLTEAVRTAKTYLHGAIAASDELKVGRGRGPVHHFHRWWRA